MSSHPWCFVKSELDVKQVERQDTYVDNAAKITTQQMCIRHLDQSLISWSLF